MVNTEVPQGKGLRPTQSGETSLTEFLVLQRDGFGETKEGIVRPQWCEWNADQGNLLSKQGGISCGHWEDRIYPEQGAFGQVFREGNKGLFYQILS